MSEWIEHTPGPCPVQGDTLVEVWFPNGDTGTDIALFWAGGDSDWWKDGHIKRYRIVGSPASPAPSDSPVRMVTKPEIVSGKFGIVSVMDLSNGSDRRVGISIAGEATLHHAATPDELDAASRTLSQLAEAMRSKQ